MNTFLILFIFTIVLLGIIAYKTTVIEPFISIRFLSPEALTKILVSKDDAYFSRFNATDWKVRGVYNYDEYCSVIYKSASNFTEYEQGRLISAAEKADKICRKYYPVEQWNFGCIRGYLFENGYPHTRGDTLIIPAHYIAELDDDALMRLCIHEKIHVLQRKYPEKTAEMISSGGFRKVRKCEVADGIRANPDTDGWIYADSTGKLLEAKYLAGAVQLNDVSCAQENEHPFEYFAIKISDE